MTELHNDPQLHEMLAPTHRHIVKAIAELLKALGAASPNKQAHDLVVLIDGLLFDHIIGSARSDPERTFTTYFEGIA